MISVSDYWINAFKQQLTPETDIRILVVDGQYYIEKKDIKRFSYKQNGKILNTEIPTKEIVVEMFNTTYIPHLHGNVRVEAGVKNGDHFEYICLGIFQVSDIKTPQNGLISTLILNKMKFDGDAHGYYDENYIYGSNKSWYSGDDLTAYLFAKTVMKDTLVVETFQNLNNSAELGKTLNVVSRIEALQNLAIREGKTLDITTDVKYYQPSGILYPISYTNYPVFKSISKVNLNINYIISEKNSYKFPEEIIEEKTANYTFYTYFERKKYPVETEIINGTIDNPDHFVQIKLENGKYWGLEDITEDFEAEFYGSELYVHYVGDNYQAGIPFSATLSLTESIKNSEIISLDNTGNDIEVDNKLITSNLAVYTKKYIDMWINENKIVETNLRIDPRIELFDAVKIYGKDRMYEGIVEYVDIEYNGSFIGIIKARVYKEEERTYTINFKNYDGTVLQTSELNYEQIPNYTGQEPTRSSDGRYDYEFKGWNKPIVKVVEDTSYYATYNKTLANYDVVWRNYDDTLLKRDVYHYEDIPEYTGATPERKRTEKYFYEFIGWDKEIVPVTEDTTYKATFNENELYYSKIDIGDIEDGDYVVFGYPYNEDEETISVILDFSKSSKARTDVNIKDEVGYKFSIDEENNSKCIFKVEKTNDLLLFKEINSGLYLNVKNPTSLFTSDLELSSEKRGWKIDQVNDEKYLLFNNPIRLYKNHIEVRNNVSSTHKFIVVTTQSTPQYYKHPYLYKAFVLQEITKPIIDEEQTEIISEDEFLIKIDNNNPVDVVATIEYSSGSMQSFNIPANGSVLLTETNAPYLITSIGSWQHEALYDDVYVYFKYGDKISEISIILEANA